MTDPGGLPRELWPAASVPELGERVGQVVDLQAQLTRTQAEFADFRDRLAALAAIEDYIGESGENAAKNIRDLLAGTGEDGNDPRVQARRWGLEWTTPDTRKEG